MNENSNDTVSFFQNNYDREPQAVTWAYIHQLLLSGFFHETTEKYRYFHSQGMDKAATEIKHKSGFIVPAVTCRGGHAMKHVLGYTGICMADFDHLPATLLTAKLRQLAKEPNVLLAYTTISGEGIRVIYRTDITDLKFHLFAFRQGNAYYSRLLGYESDPKCCNANRTSFLCECQEAVFNPDAVPMHIDTTEKDKRTVGRPHKVHRATVRQAVPAVLSLLDKRGKTYQTGCHNEFVSCAVYLMNDFGVPSEEVSGWIQTEYPEFDTAELKSIIRSVYEQHAGEFGKLPLPKEKEERKNACPVEEVEQFLNTQAHIRYNTILDRREIRFLDEDNEYRDLVDRDENTLWSRVQKAGINSNPFQIRCILNSEFITAYNPLIDYLTNLPAWDGVTDHIGQVAAMVHTENDEAFSEHFRKWFVSIIASIVTPETVNNTILVLIGRQGIYKTTFFKKLLPPDLLRYFYTKVNSGQMNKDDVISLAEYILICLEEIDNMRTSELNRFKAMVTLPSVNERAPFAHNRMYRPHLASLCGTGNNRRFLIDDTENRRWLPAFVNSIDNPFTTPIPYEGLYGQAYALFQSGFNYYFDNEEIARLQLHNQDFEEPNLEEELICAYFRVPEPGEAGIFASTAEILERIGCVIKQPLSKTKINRAMDKLGFEPVRTMRSRGFRVVILTQEEKTARQFATSRQTGDKQQDLPF